MHARFLTRLTHPVFVAGQTSWWIERGVADTSVVAVWHARAVRDVTGDTAPACVTLANVTCSVASTVTRAVKV